MSSASDLRSGRTGAVAPPRGAPAPVESGRVGESLNEIREILRGIDERGRGNAPPQGGSGAVAQNAAGNGPPRPAPPASFARAVAGPHMPSGRAAAIRDPIAEAAPDAVLPPRRRGAALAVLLTAGLAVLGAASLVVAHRPRLPHPAARVSGAGRTRLGDRPAAAARAALPPVPTPAVANNSNAAAAARRPAGAPKPQPLPVAYEGAVQTPAALARRAGGRSPGRDLRQAGDVKLLEGDVASARLFYERAADSGDARAALDLGNSFNPAFLRRLGVLGMRGDAGAAARWYRQARRLGSPDAEKALHTLPR
jgi:hypothetical protein